MKLAFRLGWTPSEFWTATMAELELALLVRIEDAEPPRAQAMTDAEMRAFYDQLKGRD